MISNKVAFNVICPQGEIDERAYEILDRTFEEEKYRRGDEFHKHFSATAELVATYPDHPYALRVYPSYLFHLQYTDPDKYHVIHSYLISRYPNSRFARSNIHSKALSMTREERKYYFDEMRSRYQGQWIVMYIDQLDDRFDRAEAHGWHKDIYRERIRELKDEVEKPRENDY